MILELLEPTCKDMADNAQVSKSIQMNYTKLKRRLDEMEFVFTKVTKNATLQQDMLRQLETNTNKLKLQEEQMKIEIMNIHAIKDRVQDQFNLLRDDRQVFLKKIETLAEEVG
jgi:CDP-diacylglycerol pyrophosphatase